MPWFEWLRTRGLRVTEIKFDHTINERHGVPSEIPSQMSDMTDSQWQAYMKRTREIMPSILKEVWEQSKNE